MLRYLSLAMVVCSYFLIHTNLATLPPRIPVHFNGAGEPNGWGTPDTLWGLLGVQLLTTIIILGVPCLGRRFPQVVNLGLHKLSDYTAAQRECILPLLHEMMGALSVLTNLFFTFLLYRIIQAARQPHPRLPIGWPLVVLIGGTVLVMICYLRKINRAAKDESIG